MKNLFNVALLLITFLVEGQSKWSKKAQEAFIHKRYSETIRFIDKIPSDDISGDEYWMKAESYRQIHDYEGALKQYEELDLTAVTNDSVYFCFAQVLESNGEYKRAEEYFRRFSTGHPSDVLSQTHIQSYQNLDQLPKNSDIDFSIFSLNTVENDFVGFIKDNELVMASSGMGTHRKVYKWDGQHFLNYYVCKEKEDEVRAVSFDPKLQKTLHEGPGYYDPISNTLYFTRNAPIHGADIAGETVSNLKIYTSKYIDGRWTKAKEMPFNDQQYSNGHPTGLPGKSFLIYSSNFSGGKGEADLYLVQKVNNIWSSPQPLEGGINTQGHELFPYLMNDSTLFFASNGHGGFGGLDLFKGKLKNGKVVSIENLGEGFNSPHDDFGLVYADSMLTEGYFASDRKGGVGESDIYCFSNSYNPYVIKVIDNAGYTIRDQEGVLFVDTSRLLFRTNELGVYNSTLSDTNKVRIKMNVDGYETYSQRFGSSYQSDTLVVVLTPLENHIQINGVILDETNHQSIYGAKVQLDADSVSYLDTTNHAGEFSFILPEKEQYYITFYKEGYFTNHITPTPVEGNIEIKEPLTPISTGMVLEIENIYYEFDQAHITFQAEEVLDSLATIMELNPTVEIEVSSHADSRGSDVYNEDLSLERAKSVIDYLKTREINSSRLSIRYYGESKLSNDCGDGIDCAETSHSLNRRTEFKVIRF